MSWRPLQLSTNQDCDSSRKALPWWRFYPRAQQNLLCFYPFMIQYIKRQHDNLFYQCSFPLLLPSTDTTSFYRVFRSRFYRQERELVWLSFIPTLIDENGYTRCIHIHRQLTIAVVAKNDKLGVWITKMWNKADVMFDCTHYHWGRCDDGVWRVCVYVFCLLSSCSCTHTHNSWKHVPRRRTEIRCREGRNGSPLFRCKKW